MSSSCEPICTEVTAGPPTQGATSRAMWRLATRSAELRGEAGSARPGRLDPPRGALRGDREGR